MHLPIFAPTFGDYKEKDQSIIRQVEYSKMLYTLVARRYKWTTPDYVPDYIPQWILAENGKGAIYKDGGFYRCVPRGTLDRYGRYTDYILTAANGETFNAVDGETCVVIHNGVSEKIDLAVIDRYAYMMSQADISLDNNVLFSRSARFYSAADDKSKIALENALKACREGKPAIAISPRPLNPFDETQGEPYQAIDITNASIAETLQHLSLLHDDLLRRFVLEYGIETNDINKRAQVTTEELHQYDQLSQIFYDDTFVEISKGIEKANEIFDALYNNPYRIERNENYTERSADNDTNGNDNNNPAPGPLEI